MPEPVRLVALCGSPRKGGNSDVLLDAAIAGAREAGAEVSKFYLRHMKISGCIECLYCNTHGVCSIKDDMQQIYDAIEVSDRLLLASPIFFYNVSSWAKACIDRFQPYWCRKALLKTPLGPASSGGERCAAFIAVGATKGKRLFEGTVMTLKYFFSDAAYSYCGHMLVRGVEHMGDAAQHPEHIEAARELGRTLVLRPHDSAFYEG
jgi:multimeric flavodoxin WrbA